MWPKVRAFLETFASGDVVADVGCGNGKYFGVRHDVAILASDRSSGLAEVAAARLTSTTGVDLCAYPKDPELDDVNPAFSGESLEPHHPISALLLAAEGRE